MLPDSAVISVTGDGVAVDADGTSNAVAVHAVTTISVTTSPIGANRRANPLIFRGYRDDNRAALRISTVTVSELPTPVAQSMISVHINWLWKVTAE